MVRGFSRPFSPLITPVEGSNDMSKSKCRGRMVMASPNNGIGGEESPPRRGGRNDEVSSSKTCKGSNEASSSRRCGGIREEDFISYRMYQIAKHEKCDWRLKQVEETTKSMLFRSPQSTQINEAIRHIQSNLVFEGSDSEDNGMDDLDQAINELDRDGNGYKPTGFRLLRPIHIKEKSSHVLPI
jgi:hypothetical protein